MTARSDGVPTIEWLLPGPHDHWESTLSTLATPVLLASSGSEGEFHAPSINDFFPPAILFEDTIFQIDRIWIIRVVAMIVLLTVFVIGARRARLVPGRFQNALEMLIDFVRVQIVEEIMGKEYARRYLPMIATIFFTVLAFNITSVIPFLNLAGTSRIGIPLLLALWVLVAYWAAGIKKHGFGGYLKNSMFPPGVPGPIYLIVAPIELLQILIIRPASLAIRLTANMIAGHIMLVLCFSATSFFLYQSDTAWFKVFSPLTFAAGFGITLFEILVAFLQAYIFALLAAVYLNMSLEEEH